MVSIYHNQAQYAMQFNNIKICLSYFNALGYEFFKFLPLDKPFPFPHIYNKTAHRFIYDIIQFCYSDI